MSNPKQAGAHESSMDLLTKALDALDRETLRSDLLFHFLILALAKLNQPIAFDIDMKGLKGKDVPFMVAVDKENRVTACKAFFDEGVRLSIIDRMKSISQSQIDRMFEPEMMN